MIALNASGAPTFRLLQVMRREVQRVDLRLGQVVSSCDVALWLVLREPWQRIDYVLLPCSNRQSIIEDLTKPAARFYCRSCLFRHSARRTVAVAGPLQLSCVVLHLTPDDDH